MNKILSLAISEEAKVKALNYKYTGREEQFRKIITSNQAVASVADLEGWKVGEIVRAPSLSKSQGAPSIF